MKSLDNGGAENIKKALEHVEVGLVVIFRTLRAGNRAGAYEVLNVASFGLTIVIFQLGQRLSVRNQLERLSV